MRHVIGAVLFASSALGCIEAEGGTPEFNYILHCQGCHLVDGRETPGRIPALRGVGRFLSVEGGREFLAQVPGVALSVLDEQELAELLNWMLHRFSPAEMPGDFEPYTAQEVARHRRRPLVEVETVRSKLIDALE